MCLHKTHIFPKFSFRDKVVYKALRFPHPIFDSESKKRYVTPYLRIPVNLGDTLKARRKNWLKTIFTGEIEGEGVHAYKKDFYTMEDYMLGNSIVAKCIIPRCTLYWESNTEIAATKIIVTDKIFYSQRQIIEEEETYEQEED